MTPPSPSPRSRRAWLDRLARAAAARDWPQCAEALFRALHGIPADVQLAAAATAARAYLPVFQQRTGARWAEEVLADPVRWVAGHGRALPELPEDGHPGDASFAFALDALVLAAAHRGDPLVLTSSCAAAISAAVEARAAAAWAEDDPEAVRAWRRTGEEEDFEASLRVAEERGVTASAAAAAERERGWREAAAWLEETASGMEDAADPARVERDLEAWKEHEMLLIVPRAEPGG